MISARCRQSTITLYVYAGVNAEEKPVYTRSVLENVFFEKDYQVVMARRGLEVKDTAQVIIDTDATPAPLAYPVNSFFVEGIGPDTDVKVTEFLTSGTFTNPTENTVDVLVVAGGGGGGSGGGAGGGAGGLIYAEGIASSGPVEVVVGDGGLGFDVGQGQNGKDSKFGTLTAIGGGGGGFITGAGLNGGSGGGAPIEPNIAGEGVAGQGYAGGLSSSIGALGLGGGGGAEEKGGDGTESKGGKGGDGLPFSISGETKFYAGGGGGASYSGLVGNCSGCGGLGGGGCGVVGDGGNGEANTGGGGGGAEIEGARKGGNGGSGIVIVKYTSLPTKQSMAAERKVYNISRAWLPPNGRAIPNILELYAR